jgi:hypothetical protein
MTKNTNHITRDKWKTYVRDLGDGVKLEAEVSPCVFMYPGYPLQITVTLHRRPDERLGKAHAVDRTETADTYTHASVERLLATVRTSPCPRCLTPAFNPATIETNRGGHCEACFLAALEAEWAEEEKTQQRKIASRDRRMKRKGMAARVTAWVHPQDGGDDYQVDWYLSAPPTPKQVGDMLSKQGSCRLDDYQIIIL